MSPDEPVLRAWSEADSLAELRALVLRAYASLAERGLDYWGTRQSLDDTRRRVESGECYVAELDGALVGTALLKPPGAEGGCACYERADVCTLHQLAVDPGRQGRGLGTRLVRHVEARAAALGAAELALDTSEQALELIAWYERLGYRIVDRADWRPHVNYRSLVLSRSLSGAAAAERRAGADASSGEGR